MQSMTLPDHIFYGNSLDAALRGVEQKMGEAAASIPPEHALAQTVDQLAAELIEKFRVEPLVLDWGAMTVSSKDTKIDVSGDWNRAIFDRGSPFYIDGTELTFHIPFTGERDLFKFQPSTFTLNPPRGIVADHELRLVASAAADSREGLKAALDGEVAKVKMYVDNANADVAGFNERLDGAASAAAERRRAKVLADRDLVASLGLPVKNREQVTPTYSVAPARPRSSRPSPGHAAQRPEPALPADEYEHILKIARGMSSVIERSPKTFASIDEEALRHHFLVQLNGHYPGGATGETFNFEGKTDILLREGDRNVFIAECKFWDGPAKLTKTVDQLLRYASWRDTKTAIFLFNRGRALTGVLSRISPTISGHDNFVREQPYGEETDFRFVVHHRDDRDRELTLTVLVFEVPGGS
jgi:hypothetical protein